MIIALLLGPTALAFSHPSAKFSATLEYAAARHSPPTLQFGDLKWPWEDKKKNSDDDERGKFVRQSELEPGCAPLGVVTAGFSEDALETLAMCIESVYEGPDGEMAAVPIAVLSKSDLRLRLREVLANIDERDSVLPGIPAQPRVPLVLLSGFPSVAVSATVRALRGLELTGGGENVRPMFAVAVPNALDKSFSMLIDEIEGDHIALSAKPEV